MCSREMEGSNVVAVVAAVEEEAGIRTPFLAGGAATAEAVGWSAISLGARIAASRSINFGIFCADSPSNGDEEASIAISAVSSDFMRGSAPFDAIFSW